MVSPVSSAYQPTPCENPGGNYAPPAWAVEAAASAPRISPADAAPLIAIFADARAACAAATARHKERERGYDHARHEEFREGFRAVLALPPFAAAVSA